MKPPQPQSRHTILWAVILCYFFPFLALSTYGALATHAPKNWNLLSLGLLLSAMGSLAIFLLLTRWESSWLSRLNTPQTPLPANDATVSEFKEIIPPTIYQEIPTSNNEEALKALEQSNLKLTSDIETLLDELRQLGIEKEGCQQQTQKAIAEFEAYKNTSLQDLNQQKVYINELQSSIADQKSLLDKRQQQISILETKVGDLTYEIKTLLQIAERHSDSISSIQESEYTYTIPTTTEPTNNFQDFQPEKQVHSSDDASRQLKRCLDIAQKITGSNRFNTQLSTFLDSPADNFSIDLRRLCDSLRSENNCTVFLYSPNENQPLFANNQIKVLTGWSPEKFIQNFNEILENSSNEWKQALSSLATKSETTVKLSLKSKTGQEVIVNGQIGLIPTGIFRYHAIAILY